VNRPKFSLFILFFIVLCLPLMMIGFPVHAQEDLSQLIPGKWNLAPNQRASEGSIDFSAKGTYELYEKHRDGAGVTTKGEYRLNEKVSPVRIDLCVGRCGAPGSEWTTRFGIIRVLPDGKLEIYTSKTEKHPSDFPGDPTGEYSMLLSR
jgi:hypothetical protein